MLISLVDLSNHRTRSCLRKSRELSSFIMAKEAYNLILRYPFSVLAIAAFSPLGSHICTSKTTNTRNNQIHCFGPECCCSFSLFINWIYHSFDCELKCKWGIQLCIMQHEEFYYMNYDFVIVKVCSSSSLFVLQSEFTISILRKPLGLRCFDLKILGEILANQFAGLGAKVILSARNAFELERVKSEIISKYPASKIEVLPLDLASGEESIKEVVKRAESLFSKAGVDFMVHNAAFERPKRKALDETEEGLRATMNINVLGTITLTSLLAPYMLERGRGHFVVMSSAAAKCPAPGQAMYSASKHALNGYFHTLRSELYDKGIKVTVVCPGPIETSKSSSINSSGEGGVEEKRVSSERCAELTIIAATHGLKEAWISYQPVLFVMYLVQYMPTLGYWLMDRIGAKRLVAAANKKSAYSWNLLFGEKKSI